VRRLKKSTAAESKHSCKVGDPHVSVCFCLSHQMAREAYNNAIQRAGKNGDVDVCFVKKCF
jgi:hypothetical protein